MSWTAEEPKAAWNETNDNNSGSGVDNESCILLILGYMIWCSKNSEIDSIILSGHSVMHMSVSRVFWIFYKLVLLPIRQN